jgi:hypothetical protein
VAERQYAMADSHVRDESQRYIAALWSLGPTSVPARIPYRIQGLVAEAWQLGTEYAELVLLNRIGYRGITYRERRKVGGRQASGFPGHVIFKIARRRTSASLAGDDPID